jgi:hypothetical protein
MRGKTVWFWIAIGVAGITAFLFFEMDDKPPTDKIRINGRNPAHDKLLQFNEDQRREAFTAGFNQTGDPCGQVTRTFFQMQDADGRAYWDVSCIDGHAYKIRINTDPDGSTTISDCALMKRLTGTACFERMKDMPKGWIAGP